MNSFVDAEGHVRHTLGSTSTRNCSRSNFALRGALAVRGEESQEAWVTTAETMAEEEKKVRRRPAPRAPRASSSTLTRADPRSRPKMWRWGRPRAPRPDSKSRSGTPSACESGSRGRAREARVSRERAEKCGPLAGTDVAAPPETQNPSRPPPPMGNSQVELGYLRRHLRHLP